MNKNKNRIHVLATKRVNMLERYGAGVTKDTEKLAA